MFPFDYEGKTVTSCTSEGQKYPWCSLTKEFKGVWKYCNDMRVSDQTCVDECVLFENEHYLSCSTGSGQARKYCTGK